MTPRNLVPQDSKTCSLEHAVMWSIELAIELSWLIEFHIDVEECWSHAICVSELMRDRYRQAMHVHEDEFIAANIDHLKPYVFRRTQAICAFSASPKVVSRTFCELSQSRRDKLHGETSSDGDLPADERKMFQSEIAAGIAALGEEKLLEFCCDLQIEATRVRLRNEKTRCANGFNGSQP